MSAAVVVLDAEAGSALHARLLAAEPDAPSDLAVAYFAHLIGWLSSRNPGVDPQLCESAAGDAILSLAKHPAAYKPERGTLDAYMRMAALGDLRNLLARERRHSSRRADLAAVELSPLAGKYVRDEEADPARILERREEEAMIRSRQAVPEAVRAVLSSGERKVLELMRRGERRTADYARVLELAHLSLTEQRQEVKRVKDRLKKRWQRAGRRDG